jgi:hypothetical protein
MSSILKVDTIQDQSGNNIINENADTITIGAAGDTITIPAGATIDTSGATLTLPTTIEVDTIEPQSGTSLTLGASGDTITIPSGATIDLSSATQTGVGGVNTPAFEATQTSSQTISNTTVTKIQFGTEVFDSDSCFDSTTNYRFTPTTAGKYHMYAQAIFDTNAANQLYAAIIRIRKNGSDITNASQAYTGNNSSYSGTASLSYNTTIDMNGTTDYLEVFGYIQVSAGTPSIVQGRFGAFKLIGA